MPSGGARVRSGPPPDLNALSRDRPIDQATWTNLPSVYEGAQPDWPLSSNSPLHPRELVLWEDLWCKPQAAMWARLGQHYEVAMFCRVLAQAEILGSPVMLQTVVLRYLDSLGLSTAGLAKNRWRILSTPSSTLESTDGQPVEQVASAPRRSARERFKVVAADG